MTAEKFSIRDMPKWKETRAVLLLRSRRHNHHNWFSKSAVGDLKHATNLIRSRVNELAVEKFSYFKKSFKAQNRFEVINVTILDYSINPLHQHSEVSPNLIIQLIFYSDSDRKLRGPLLLVNQRKEKTTERQHPIKKQSLENLTFSILLFW